MSARIELLREAQFLGRDRSLVLWLAVVAVLACASLASGVSEVHSQQVLIDSLLQADREERERVLDAQQDWGSAAYYSFHLTYDPPTEFAFVALGRRDQDPWKHRVRMLALEGQIYERDSSNPVLALIGRFDFAFFAAFVLPLVLIVLLHDAHARERTAGRHALLLTTSGSARSPWRQRAQLKAAGVFTASALPLLVISTLQGVAASTQLAAACALLAYVIFWALVCGFVAQREQASSVLLTILLGAWLVLAVIVPSGGRLLVDYFQPVPSGADITLTQREAVNDAWDLPVETTMDAFVERHPEWIGMTAVDEQAFEWKWYYAFQQVGDMTTEPLTDAYRAGRQRRDELAGIVSLASPPALLERFFQSLAETDLTASLAYEAEVRRFHADLRAYYYEQMFRKRAYESAALEDMPTFNPS
ncbi:MAG: DUF3526 domain-containing protein [Pseudomonadota bacterium]